MNSVVEKKSKSKSKSKSWFELIRMSAGIMGLQCSRTVVTAFVTPLLLSLGASYQMTTLSWSASPLFGFILAPLLSSFGKRCNAKYGKRRTFTVLFSILVVLGLSLIPNGKALANIIESIQLGVTNGMDASNSSKNTRTANNSQFLAIGLTMLGVTIADFSSDALENPNKVYLLELCTKEERKKALSIFNVMAGGGGAVGYFIGSVDWSKYPLDIAFGSQEQITFAIIILVFVAFTLISVTSFNETFLLTEQQTGVKNAEHDEICPYSYSYCERKKETEITTEEAEEKEEENSSKVVVVNSETKNGMDYSKENEETNNNNNNSVKHLQEEVKETNNGTVRRDDERRDNSLRDGGGGGGTNINFGVQGERKCEKNSDSTIASDCGTNVKYYITSLLNTPYAIKSLFLTNLLCWISHTTYILYFTDFVGETVFKGNPESPVNSTSSIRYQEGVRFACIGMSACATSCLLYSLVVQSLINRFGYSILLSVSGHLLITSFNVPPIRRICIDRFGVYIVNTLKSVYVTNLSINSFAQFSLFLFIDETSVVIFSFASGILYCTIFTMPYLLTAQYHICNVYDIDDDGNPMKVAAIRGMGTDIAIVSSCAFAAKFILSASMGELMSRFSTRSIPLINAVASAMAAYAATAVVYPDVSH